jgi:hypothetical protein
LNTTWNELSVSPDGRSKLTFVYHHEIRFGPAFFRLRINELDLAKRLFAGLSEWSADSTLVAVTEYRRIDLSSGMTDASLLIINARDMTVATFPVVENAHVFAKDFRGSSHTLVHVDQFYGGGLTTVVRETDLDTLDGWDTLAPNEIDPTMRPNKAIHRSRGSAAS